MNFFAQSSEKIWNQWQLTNKECTWHPELVSKPSPMKELEFVREYINSRAGGGNIKRLAQIIFLVLEIKEVI